MSVLDREKFVASRRLHRRLLGSSIGLFGSLLAPAAALAIDEFPLPPGTQSGRHDGRVLTGRSGSRRRAERSRPPDIGRHHDPRAYTRFQLAASTPDQIAVGPDGRIWFTESGANRIGAVTTAARSQEYPHRRAGAAASRRESRVGPDGNLGSRRRQQPHPLRSTPRQPRHRRTRSRPPRATRRTSSSARTGGCGSRSRRDGEQDRRASNTRPAASRNSRRRRPGSEPSGIIDTAGGILWFTEAATGAIGRITTGTGAGSPSFPGAGRVPVRDRSRAGRRALVHARFRRPPRCLQGTGDHAIGRITSGGTITNKFAHADAAERPVRHHRRTRRRALVQRVLRRPDRADRDRGSRSAAAAPAAGGCRSASLR